MNREEEKREILFRGFHKNPNGPDIAIIDGEPVRGEWVYGNLFHDPDLDTYAIMGFEYSIGDGGQERAETWFDVIPSTVAQYTGRTDKNGVKIFEGDIVRSRGLGYHTKPEEMVYEVKYSTEKVRFLAVLPNGVFNPTAFGGCEVIGNIHDNPELLEGDSEG